MRALHFCLLVSTLTQPTQSAVLKAAKHVISPINIEQSFPTTRQDLRTLMNRRCADPVLRAVKLRASIDMSSVGLEPISFEFIDPVWMWVRQAAEVGKTHKLWFECRDAINAGGAKMYGGGVQYGEAMRQAVHACKPGQVPALLALHFDKGLLGAFSRRDLGTPSRDAIPRCHPRTSVPHMHTRDVISGRRPEMSSQNECSHTYTHEM